MTSFNSEMDSQIREFLGGKMVGVVPPGTLKRMTAEDIAGALGGDVGEVRERLEGMVGEVDVGGLFVREHYDGRYSCSGASPFEHLFGPCAFEVERLVVEGRFGEVDGLLAATGMRARKVADGAPELVWADGTVFSQGARDWYLGQLLGNKFYVQGGVKDVNKAVEEAHDLLRDALDDGSARALVGWVLGTKFPKSCRAQIPRHAASFEEIGEVLLGAGKRLEGFAVDGMFRAGVLGRRWLLRYGVMGATRRLGFVHEAWPEGDDVTGSAGEWRVRMREFLEHAVEVGARFGMGDFERYYLGNPLMGPLLKGADLEAVGECEVRIVGLKGFKVKEDRAEAVVPAVTKKTRNGVRVGSRARVSRGDLKGVEGEVCWLGRSRYSRGLRAGLEDIRGEVHWVAAGNLELVDG